MENLSGKQELDNLSSSAVQISESRMDSAGNEHFLCIIIIGKNEEKFIGKCIESCIQALEDFDDYEIVFVDSLSDDKTVEIATQYEVSIYQLVDDTLLSAAAGRYIGSLYSNSKYIFYIDGDMVLDRNWFRCAIPFMEKHPDIYGAGGMRPNAPEGEAVNAVHSSPCQDSLDFNYVKVLDGGAGLFRREGLEIAGYHNPFLRSGEEAELSFRLQGKGFKLARISIPMIHHLGIVKYQGVSLGRMKYYTGVGQILRSYFLKPNSLMVYRHSLKYILNVMYLSMIAICIFAGLLVNKIYLLAFLGLNLLILLPAIAVRKNIGLAFTSLAKYYLKGYYILLGFSKGLIKPEKYPQDVKILKRTNHHEIE